MNGYDQLDLWDVMRLMKAYADEISSTAMVEISDCRYKLSVLEKLAARKLAILNAQSKGA